MDDPREGAARRGDTTYHGKPCGYGHGTERYVSNSGCVTCQKARAQARHERYKRLREQAQGGK